LRDIPLPAWYPGHRGEHMVFADRCHNKFLVSFRVTISILYPFPAKI
jgi:hypothetical protein